MPLAHAIPHAAATRTRRAPALLTSALILLPALGVIGSASADETEVSPVSLPTPRSKAATVWTVQYAYVIGGWNGNGALSDILRYDPTATDPAQAVQKVADLPQPLYHTAAAWDGSQYVYVFGGLNATNIRQTKILRYDLTSDTVEELSFSLPYPIYAAAAAWTGSNAYLFGSASSPQASTQIVRFTPGSNPPIEVLSSASLSPGRQDAAAAYDGSHIYLFGGRSGSLAFSSLHRFDPGAETLEETGVSLPTGLSAASAVWDGAEDFYVFGGQTPSGPTNGIVRYTPALDEVRAGASASLPTGRAWTGAVWADGNAHVIGGYGYDESNNLGELDEIVLYSRSPPAAPQSLDATDDENSRVTLTWPPVNYPDDGGATVTEYKVYRNGSEPEEYEEIGTSQGTSYVDETAVNGIQYHYKVSAKSAAGESDQSESASATPGTTPGAPVLTAVSGDGTVELAWQLTEDGGRAITGYRVERAPGALEGQGIEEPVAWTERWNSSGNSDPDETSFTDPNVADDPENGVVPGVEYCYRVTAENTLGWGVASHVACVTPHELPDSPASLTGQRVDRTILLTWQPPADAPYVERYVVYRQDLTDPTSPGQRIQLCENEEEPEHADDCPATPVFVDEAPEWDRTYRYNVTSARGAFESEPASTTVDISDPNPSEPQNLEGQSVDRIVVLTWEAPEKNAENVEAYRVYRGDASGDVESKDPICECPPATSFVDADDALQHGGTYYYQVTAVRQGNESLPSNEAQVDIGPDDPGAPGALVGHAVDRTVHLAWVPPQQNPENVEQYVVYRQDVTDPASPGDEIQLCENEPNYPDPCPTDLTFVDDDPAIEWGRTYQYNVTSARGPTESGRAATEVEVESNETHEPIPLRGVATAQGARLAWVVDPDHPASLKHVTEFIVYRWNETQTEEDKTRVCGAGEYKPCPGGTEFTFLDDAPDLERGKMYWYQVTASNGEAESGPSDPAQVEMPRPGAPLFPEATVHPDGRVFLTWAPPATNSQYVERYEVYRGPNRGLEGKTPVCDEDDAPECPALPFFVDEPPQGTHWYMVVAVSGPTKSSPSSDVTATIDDPKPGSPSNLEATHHDRTVVLRWNPPVDDPLVDKYVVYRGTDPGNKAPVCGGDSSGSECPIAPFFVDTDVEYGETYHYNVTAVRRGHEGDASNDAQVTIAPDNPSEPLALTAAPDPQDRNVHLRWLPPANHPESVEEYVVYRGTTPENIDTQICGTPGYPACSTPPQVHAVVSFQDQDPALQRGVPYHYEIAAKRGEYESGRSNSAEVIIPPSAPSAPDLYPVQLERGTAKLTWDESEDDGGSQVEEYIVSRDGVPLDIFVQQTSYDDEDEAREDGETYCYTVRARNMVGVSDPSDESCVDLPQLPGPVTSAEPKGAGEIKITWDPASGEFTHYRVYRQEGGTLPWTPAGDVAKGTLEFTDSGLLSNTEYCYRLALVNEAGDGRLGPEAAEGENCAATHDVPNAPQDLEANFVAGITLGVELDWNPPPESGGSPVTEYNIYRGTNGGNAEVLAQIGTNTSYVDFSVQNGQTYAYTVTAVSDAGEGASSDEASVNVASPDAPDVTSATYDENQDAIMVTWEAPENADNRPPATNYKVYRGTASGSTSFLVQIGATTFYTDSSAQHGNTYYYNVTAVNAIGEGPSSQEESVSLIPPSAPQGLKAGYDADSNVELNWDTLDLDDRPPVTAYRIYRGTASGNAQFFAEIGTNTSYTDLNAQHGNTYYYNVTAVNAIGEGSSTSAEKTVNIEAPHAPTSTSLAYDPSQDAIMIMWEPPVNTDNRPPVTGYKVYRNITDSSSTFTLIDEPGAVLSSTDTDLHRGLTYYYQVSAVNVINEGSYSGASTTTPDRSTPPVDFRVTAGEGNATLTWEEPEDTGTGTITSFKIERQKLAPQATNPSDAEWEEISLNPTNDGSWSATDDFGIVNKQRYCWRVMAVTNPDGNTMDGDPSPHQCKTPDYQPGTPALIAEAGDGKVDLQWTPPVRAVPPGGPYPGSPTVEPDTDPNSSSLPGPEYAHDGSFTVYNGPSAIAQISWELASDTEPEEIVVITPPAEERIAIEEDGDVLAEFSWEIVEGGCEQDIEPDGSATACAPEDENGDSNLGVTVSWTILPGLDTEVTEVDPENPQDGSITVFYKDNGILAKIAWEVLAPSPDVDLSSPDGNVTATLDGELVVATGSRADIVSASGYKVYVLDGTGNELEVIEDGLDSSVATAHSHENLVNGQAYCYEVSTLNGDVEGPRSPQVCVTPHAAPEAPEITAQANNDSGLWSIELEWAEPADNGATITGYLINRSVLGMRMHTGDTGGNDEVSTSIFLPYQQVGLEDAPETTPPTEYTDDHSGLGLHPGVEYCYTVAAVYQSDVQAGAENPLPEGPDPVSQGMHAPAFVGATSEPACARPGDIPPPPRDLTAQADPDDPQAVTLTWQAPPGNVEKYRVYWLPASNAFTAALTAKAALDVPVDLYRQIAAFTTEDGASNFCDLNGACTHTQHGLVPGQEYVFVVTAVNDDGESPPSNEARATPGEEEQA